MTQFYTIQELSAEVGGDVTPRTIRYYIAEGLLPKPDERGQYTQNHLQRLLLIRRYREAFVPLEKIRAQLITLTDAQVAETLRETPSPSAPPASKETAKESAADYTARLLAGLGGHAPPPQAPSRKAAPAAPGNASAPSAGPDLQATLSLHRQLNERNTELNNERNLDREASKPTDAPPTETWERIPLAPGVELHRRVPLTPEAETYLQRLLAYARTLPEPAE